MVLIRNKLNLPLDILIFLNGWIKYEKLTDENFKEAIKLWFENKNDCKWKYGHISYG